MTKVDANQPERVRLLAQAPRADESRPAAGGKALDVDAQPVGESHFENKHPMTVDRGSSAMVSMVRDVTQGEVVYLYDAESERGNARFALWHDAIVFPLVVYVAALLVGSSRRPFPFLALIATIS